MKNIKKYFEKILPMTFTGLILLGIVLYMMFILGKSIWTNYKSNQDIVKEEQKVEALEDETAYLVSQIAYYKTNSFREKQARAKLGYKAPGENVISLAMEEEVDNNTDSGVAEEVIKTPNYRLWWSYFFN